ncbi:MAG: peptidoglycan DD-metalloendopeptidase family protein [Oscillospiraceae bacterium]|nr:peptidoglycan DD-metalloendopeptidase family protein [Oscillospiraceae bacterium]
MKNKRVVARVIAILLALLMAATILFGVLGSLAPAGAAVTRAQIDRLRAEQREIQQRRQETQARINSIEFDRMTAFAQKEVLDNRISLTEAEIELIRDTIAQYGYLIAAQELEVIEAQNRENARLQLFRERVRSMEENGVITYLDILFSATSFSDFLARLDFVGDLMRADESAYHNLIAARLETEAAKEALEETKAELEAEEILLQERYAELEIQREEAVQLILQIEQDREAAMELYRQIREQQEQSQRDINRLEEEWRRQEAARIAREASAGRTAVAVRGTGELVWPVAGTNRSNVTSPFGVRRHPVFGTNRMHNGIDIGAPHGRNVFAADSGSVIISRHNASFGNYIVIAHGGDNRMTTLYAHLSTRSVSVGDTVSRGQVIGRVGSTGISTGPHLHFEVTVNGVRVNPLAHLP